MVIKTLSKIFKPKINICRETCKCYWIICETFYLFVKKLLLNMNLFLNIFINTINCSLKRFWEEFLYRWLGAMHFREPHNVEICSQNPFSIWPIPSSSPLPSNREFKISSINSIYKGILYHNIKKISIYIYAVRVKYKHYENTYEIYLLILSFVSNIISSNKIHIY